MKYDKERINAIRMLKALGASYGLIGKAIGVASQSIAKLISIKNIKSRNGKCPKCKMERRLLQAHHTNYVTDRYRLLCARCHSMLHNRSKNKTGYIMARSFYDDGMREKRKDAGPSMSQVASEMGISLGYLCDLERGKRKWNDRLAASFESAVAKLKKKKR